MNGNNRTVAPSVGTVTLVEAKAHLRVDIKDDDTLISALILAADGWVEGYLERSLITQTWEHTRDAFPWWAFELPFPPLQSITSIKYIDTDGVEQTFSSSLYLVDTSSTVGRVAPAWGEVWPSTRNQMGAVTVTLTTGFGSAPSDVPQQIRQAVLLMVAQMYEHREPVVIGAPASEVPFTVKALLDPYRVYYG